MPEYGRSTFGRMNDRRAIALALAASLIMSGTSAAFAADPGSVDQTYNGRDVAGGTYYNTPDGKTTFTNTGGTGLYIKPGDVVVGRQVDPGTLLENGHGGNLHFSAPGQVVRFDGNVDVSGFLKDGQLGNGGNVTIDAGAFYQNGQIFANGANGGLVQMNVSSMTMGPDARIEARGLQGAGGVISINGKDTINIARGAVLDSSGAVIGTYNTNVIQVKGGIVNLDGIIQANGLAPGQNGGKVEVYATDSINIGPDGKLLANGADGFVGHNPTNGGKGGEVFVTAEKNLHNDGLIAANGGKGGTNPNAATNEPGYDYTPDGQVYVDEHGNRYLKMEKNGQDVFVKEYDHSQVVSGENLHPQKVQYSEGQHGGHGGDGGTVTVSFKGDITNRGAIEVKGGDGGDGQQAISDTEIDGPHTHIALGGNGGNGGTGGYVEFRGNPSQDVLNNVNVEGGSGGQGGAAATLNDCGCAIPGAAGGCGAPGKIAVLPHKTPPPPPTPPLFPPYPKEYPNLGDTLPPGVGQVLNYNRSIFLARAPLPIIQKRTPPPPPPPAPVQPAPAKPKPKPPQKKVPVRGYW
jgi:hypothetical protein